MQSQSSFASMHFDLPVKVSNTLPYVRGRSALLRPQGLVMHHDIYYTSFLYHTGKGHLLQFSTACLPFEAKFFGV
jgi:hypothetical protein